MSATGCYIIGSMIFLTGGIVSNAPTWMIVGSGMFLLGGLVSLIQGNK